MTVSFNFLANALNHITGAIWVVDPQMTKTFFVNSKFRELLSFPDDIDPWEINVLECVKRLGGIFESVDWHGGNTRLALGRLRDTSSFSVVLPTCNGRHIKLDRFAESDGCAVINFTDVTELVLATERAKEAEVAKTAFLANMSHEIRTPMNGVLGMTQVLATTELNDRQRSYVDLITRSGQSLISIINDILDFSKLESGKFTVHSDPFDFSEMITDIVNLMGHSARAKNLELILDMPDYPPQKFLGDGGRLRQVLLNLIGNAIKFTLEGHINFSVNITSYEDSAQVEFMVSDTGVGIDEDKVGDIFQQFAQADNSSTRQFGGTGLGLTISQQLVRLMGGSIDVVSTPGLGSSFSFSLDFPISDLPTKENPVYNTLDNPSILVIDDIAINHVIMSYQLKAIGANPICVNGGRVALRVMKEAAAKNIYFPLVISDFQMPDMDGINFVQALRQEDELKDTPVMILSSVDLSDKIDMLAKLGVTHVHEKPCLADDFNRAVFEVMAENNVTHLKKISEKHLEAAPGAAPKTSKIKVLAADDDEINREVIKELLSRSDIDMTITEDGFQAVEAFKRDTFDVVLLDISMPMMDGVTAAKAIRMIEAKEKSVPTPIIATTAHAMPEDKKRFLEAGMNQHIAKPLDKILLIEHIFKWAKAKRGAADIMNRKPAKAG